MPSKTATGCKQKAVFIAVYVEKPRRSLEKLRRSIHRKSLSNKNNNQNYQRPQHHHHHHHHFYQVKRTSNRKADLLTYSQRLRESARSGASSPTLQHPKPPPAAASASSHNQPPPMAQISPFRSKPKQRQAPICMNWKIIIPRIFKPIAVFKAKREKKKMKKKTSESASTKAKAIMKRFKSPKRGGFFSKVLAIIQKYR